MDLAHLGIRVDSRSARGASSDLNRLAVSGDRADASMNSLKISAAAMGRALAGAAGAFVSLTTLQQASRESLNFGAAMSEVSTLLNDVPGQMKALEQSARDLSKQYGGSATKQANAYYQAISAGATDAASATAILDTANKLAIGGVTEVTVGVDILTTTINAYGRDVISAEQASDALFVGMRAGKTTIAELAGSLGTVIPIARAMDVSFEEVVAGTAALTTQGIATSEAVTGLRAALTAITAPSKQATDLANSLGLQFDSQSLSAKGLSVFLSDVIAKTGGSSDAMATLFGSTEATTAALALAGGGSEKFSEILDSMAVKAGATSTAFEKMAGDDLQRYRVALANIGDGMISIGNIILSVGIPAMEVFANNLQNIAGVATVVATIFAARLAFSLGSTLVVATVAAVQQTIALELALGAASTKAALASAATKLLSRSLVFLKGALIATGIGALVVGAGVLVGYFYKLVSATGGWGEALSLLGDVASGVWEGIKTSAKSIHPSLNAVWANVQSGFYSMLSNMSQLWVAFLGNLGADLEGVPGFNSIGDLLLEKSGQTFRLVSEFDAKATKAANAAAKLNAEAQALATQGFDQAKEAASKLAATVAGTTTNSESGATAAKELRDALVEIPTASSGAGKSLESAADAAKSFQSALSDAAYTAESWATEKANILIGGIDGVSNAWGNFVSRGMNDFSGFVDTILGSFQSMLAQMIAMAAKNRVMISLGIGGIATPGLASAGEVASGGTGLLGGLLGNLGGVASGVWSGLGGILSGGGLSASFANLGGLVSGATSGLGAIGAALPAFGLAVAGLSLLIGKTKELDAGLRVTVDGFDSMIETFRQTETRRLFGLIKTQRTSYGAASGEVADPMLAAIAELQSGVVDMASVLGVGASAFDDFATQVQISTRGLSDDEIAAEIQTQLGLVADSMADVVLAGRSVVRDGEGASEALTRLSSSLSAVSTVVDTLGHMFDQTGVAGAALASDLVDAFGGLDALNSATTAYFTAFYSEAEQQAVSTRQMTEALAELNVSMPATRAAYRALVEAQDLTTASGQQVYAALISMSAAMDAALPSVAGFTTLIASLVGDTSSLVDSMITDAGSMARDAATAATNWYQASETIRDLLGDLINANTGTSASRDQALRFNRGAYEDAIAAARGGDIDAARDVPTLAKAYLDSVKGTATNYASYMQAVGRVAADANHLSGIAELEGANQDVLVTLYEEQIGIMGEVRDYLTSTDQIDPSHIASFEAQLGSLQTAIQAAELFSYDYLKERLKVTVDLLPTANLPSDVAALIRAANSGISSSIDFAVNASGLTPDLRWLAVNAASEHIKTLDFAVGSELDADTIRIALNRVGDLSKTVNLIGGSDLSGELKQIALAGSSELSRVVNVTLASSANTHAMQLALQNVGEYDVAVRAALHSSISDRVRQIVFSDGGTYAASIEAAVSQQMPDWARRALLDQQGGMIVNVGAVLASGLDADLKSLLLNANTSALRAVTVAVAFANQVSPEERALLLARSETIRRSVAGNVWISNFTADEARLLRATTGTVRRALAGTVDLAGLDTDRLRMLRAEPGAIDRIIAGAVDLGALGPDQLSLLRAINGSSNGKLTLAGGVLFDPSSAFSSWFGTTTQSQIAAPMAELSGTLSALTVAVLEQNAALAAQRAEQVKNARIGDLEAFASGLVGAGNGQIIATSDQIRGLAAAGGLDASASIGHLQSQITGFSSLDGISSVSLYTPELRDFLLANVADPNLQVDRSAYLERRPGVLTSELFNGDAQAHWEAFGRAEMLSNPNWFAPHLFDWSSIDLNIPTFARGGDHLGGIRLVGENGPELEATGPARIYNARQTQQMLGAGDQSGVVRELIALRQEVAAMREQDRAIGRRQISEADKQSRLLNRFENLGMPKERT
ncbi:MAG: phage tail tape measure protein [Thalassovita sp.]